MKKKSKCFGRMFSHSFILYFSELHSEGGHPAWKILAPDSLVRISTCASCASKIVSSEIPYMGTIIFLGVSVQTGEHSSVQDAQAAVRLYTMVR